MDYHFLEGDNNHFFNFYCGFQFDLIEGSLNHHIFMINFGYFILINQNWVLMLIFYENTYIIESSL
jgi:hypothetical protein